MRCHIAAFAAMGGAPEEILHDRMKTAVIGESEDGVVTCNASLVALLNHHGVVPRACRPYRAKTTDEIEQPLSTNSCHFLRCGRPRGEERGVRWEPCHAA